MGHRICGTWAVTAHTHTWHTTHDADMTHSSVAHGARGSRASSAGRARRHSTEPTTPHTHTFAAGYRVVIFFFFSLFHINYNKWGRESESESRVLLSIVLSVLQVF